MADKNLTAKKAEEKKTSVKKNKGFDTSKVIKYFKDCRAELNKIVWPSTKTTFKNFGIVLLSMVIVGVFVYALDTIFGTVLSLIMQIAG